MVERSSTPLIPAARHTYHRILISRMKFIGDVVLTTPLIRSVRRAFPHAYIAYLGEKEAVSLLEQNPNLDEIIPFDFSRPTFMEQPRVVWLLRRRRFDLTIDLFSNPRSALLSFLSGAATRVGAERGSRARLYTIRVRDDGMPKTAIQFHSQYINAVGIDPTSEETEITLTDAERRDARIYLRWLSQNDRPLDFSKPIIGIHPGATWPAKEWLPERFGELADLLTARLGAQVVVTRGPKDDESARRVTRASSGDVKILPVLPLRQLAAIISLCRLYISNDAGPMHIAPAVGTPTIGLFGPGEENIWFPYSRKKGHIALRHDVPCHPCHLDFCNRQGTEFMECMKLLTVNDVFSVAEQSMKF